MAAEQTPLEILLDSLSKINGVTHSKATPYTPEEIEKIGQDGYVFTCYLVNEHQSPDAPIDNIFGQIQAPKSMVDLEESHQVIIDNMQDTIIKFFPRLAP